MVIGKRSFIISFSMNPYYRTSAGSYTTQGVTLVHAKPRAQPKSTYGSGSKGFPSATGPWYAHFVNILWTV